LLDYGFRALIAPSFADIFANNCMKNGIVPVILSEAEVSEIARRASASVAYALTVDLERCEVRDEEGLRLPFTLDEFRRHCLLEGLDDIALTLNHESNIKAYESRRPRWREIQSAPAASS
jgi:3-isopropylmalate/(R)-2-methylmalate dehydratase small subunit